MYSIYFFYLVQWIFSRIPAHAMHIAKEEEEIKVITFKMKLWLDVSIIAQYIIVQACIIQHITKNVKEENL